MAVTLVPTAALQTIIATRRRISVDGHFGFESLSAFHALPVTDQAAVKHVAKMMDIQIDDSTVSGFFVSKEAVDITVDEVSFLTSVPASFLKTTLFLENYRASDGDGFIVKVTGKHRGLGQFDRATWMAVMPGVSYEKVQDSYQSILAIARLYDRNKRSFVTQGAKPEDFSDATAYLYHNQGASSALSFLKTGVIVFPDQSLNAKRFFEQAKKNYEIRTV